MERFHMVHPIFSCIIVCSVAIFRITDGGSITWYEPPPFETVTDPLIIPAAYKNLTKSSRYEELSCNFSLTADLSLNTVAIKFGGSSVVTYLAGQQLLSIPQGRVSRFNASWVPNKLTVVFLNLTSADKGQYRCEVVSFGAEVQTWVRTIEVSLLVHPSIYKITGNTVSEGGNVTLKCFAEGEPTPSIVWRRLSDNSVVTMPLVGIRRHDVRNYSCTAKNGVGIPASREVYIDVQYPVEATGKAENATLLEGNAKNLSCPTDGNPKPNITWFRESEVGGIHISSGEQLTVEKVMESVCYTCVASNSLGRSISLTQCLIVEKRQTTFTKSPSTPISEGPPWTVIGVVIGLTVFVAIAIIGVVTWWMRKKRNCRKGTKRGELEKLDGDRTNNGEGL